MPKKADNPVCEGLNDKQAAFVREYLKDSCGKRSAIAAGYSAKTAESLASTLLTHPKVKAALRKAQEEAWALATMGLAEAKSIASEIARARVVDFIDPATGRITVHGRPNSRAVAKLEVTNATQGTGTVTKLALHSPIQAIERLAKLSGWDKDGGVQMADVFTRLLDVIAGAGRDIPGAKHG